MIIVMIFQVLTKYFYGPKNPNSSEFISKTHTEISETDGEECAGTGGSAGSAGSSSINIESPTAEISLKQAHTSTCTR